MAVAPVKASGGCSAPASGDQELALSRMGKMRLKQLGSWRQNEIAEAQFMVRHPNYSGFQQDQLTQLWIPAHRSEEHTSELQSPMRLSSAVFCLTHKKNYQ